MAYSNFTPQNVVKQLGLRLEPETPLGLTFEPREPSVGLLHILRLGSSIAIEQQTEKARSEFMIAPILLEVRGLLGGAVALFSGIEFNVDSSLGLIGVCDFLFAKSKHHLYLESPALAVVEAKNENFKQGIAQAAAEMYAAQIYNEREGTPTPRMYGAVTIGNEWRFLKLENGVLTVDDRFYDLDDLPSILGLMTAMLESKLPKT
jgi:hypothetical protein